MTEEEPLNIENPLDDPIVNWAMNSHTACIKRYKALEVELGEEHIETSDAQFQAEAWAEIVDRLIMSREQRALWFKKGYEARKYHTKLEAWKTHFQKALRDEFGGTVRSSFMVGPENTGDLRTPPSE